MKIKKNLLCFLFIAFFLNMVSVLLICIPDTQYSLPMNRMVVYPLVCSVVFTLAAFIIGRIPFFCDANRRWQFALLIVYLIVYSMILYKLSVQLECIPIYDDAHVRSCAMYNAGLASDADWTYFAKYRNNIAPMTFVSQILRIAIFFGMEQPVHLVFWTNIIQIDVAIICIFLLIIRFFDRAYKYGLAWISVGILSVNLAAVGHTQSTYTDAMSFCFGVVAFWVWSHIREGQSIRKKGSLALLAGAVWGVGASIKMTVMISFIAVFCQVIFCEKLKEKIAYVGLSGMMMLVPLLGFSLYAETLPSAALVKEYGTPQFSYWIAEGMKGDGSYGQNGEYILMLFNTPGLEQREIVTRKYILDNIGEFTNIYHILAKIKCNFAFGTFGSEEFTEIPGRENMLYQIFAFEQPYFKRYAMAATSYFYALLILYAVGILSAVITIMRRGSCSQLQVVSIFTAIGLMIYVCIFEANNRQLYNHVPWFVLCAVCGIDGVLFIITNIVERLTKNGASFNKNRNVGY